MSAAPRDTVHRFADLLEVDAERVRLWMSTRSAAEPREVWTDESHAHRAAPHITASTSALQDVASGGMMKRFLRFGEARRV